MQGNIAQALALTCVGNAYLRGRDVSGFWPHADVFKFTKLCEFRDIRGGADTLIAADPHEWFTMLARHGCLRFRLHHSPRVRGPQQSIPIKERESVGFVGGGPAWFIEAVGEGGAVLWQGFDRLGDRNDPDQKIWLTAYLHPDVIEPLNVARTPLPQAAAELERALAVAGALAAQLGAHACGDWASVFSGARAALTADNPTPLYYDFARFADLNLEQRRLWLCCVQGWVFGGMGSWNDQVPPEPVVADYERVSDALFRALCDAIAAIADSTY